VIELYDQLNTLEIRRPWKGFVGVDGAGRLEIPPEVALRCGLRPGARVYLESGENGLLLRRPVTALARVYVEPTNTCNLECRTCVRRVWEEPLGAMEPWIFKNVLEGVRAVEPRPEVFFGGFGEPLGHPEILAMVGAAHEAGARTELITNGVLLQEETARGLIEAGLDFLWVSLDGATPDSYLDVRLGDELPRILENLRRLRPLRYSMRSPVPKLGIAFVAMKRNLQDLPEVVSLGRRLGVRRFHVSNVLPYTEEMREEVLYGRSLWEDRYRYDCSTLPRMDTSPRLLAVWEKLAYHSDWTALAGREFGGPLDACPFVERGSVSVRWDGKVSPCLPLLHTHDSYLGDTHRRNEAYFAGTLEESSLQSIWTEPGYVRLRERLQEFDFSPCTTCNSCEMAEGNVEDCFGSEHPACGGCLWAQGFVRCP